ncbi:MAG: CoA transferase [Chloroflexi bacterium]|nr:CoA transferase [Chloroflexota bacterium]
MAYRFLKGTRIVEWGEAITAPFCGKVLADLGAEVIKIECLPNGDPGRGLPPFAGDVPGDDRSLLFAHLNAEKRGVAIDVRTKAGRDLLHGLLGKVDAFIEDRPLREKESLGLTYAALRRSHPSLVVTTVTPYGSNGPYRNDNGYPSVSFHMSGAGWVTPPEVESVNEPPLSLPGRPAAMAAGLCAASGTQMALFARQYDGEGRHVDVSEVESIVPMMATPINRVAFDGREARREERVHGIAPFDFYPVKDGWVSIFLVQEAHWQRFVKLMGDPEWAKVAPFNGDRRQRAQYKEDLNDLMLPWLMQQEKEDLYIKCQALDIPVGPSRSMTEVLADPQFAARESWRKSSHPAFGAMTYLRPPYLTSREPWATPQPSPRLGQHTREVLGSVLGLSRTKLAALATAGVTR